MSKEKTHTKTQVLSRNAFLAFWLAATLQSILAASWILGVFSASAPGLSGQRLLVASLVLLPSLAFVILLYLHQNQNKKYTDWIDQIRLKLTQESYALRIIIPAAANLLAGAYLVSVTPEISEPFTRNLLENLLPLFVWLIGLATQVLLFVTFPRLSTLKNIRWSKVFLLAVLLWVLVFLVWTWVAQVSYPLESQVRGWNRQGVPLMETQVFLAWLTSLAFLGILLVLEHQQATKSWFRKVKPTHLDLVICLTLWISAVIFWQGIATPTSWFITEDRPPNFEPYPNSDAYHYDISAQTALVGEGFIFFDAPFIRRPLHAAYLTLVHVLAGQDMSKVISIQILVLAFLPVIVYLVTRSLHNRVSGLLAAILILVREASSIAISGNITASHVKLLMVDVPITLMVTLFVLAVMGWLKKPKPGRFSGLIAGGVLGASILIRAETVIFTAPLVLILWLVLPRENRWRTWLSQILLFAWGMSLVLAPWVYRNWSLTGDFFLDSPISRFDLVAQRYQSMVDQVSATPTLTQTPATPVPTSTHPLETEILTETQPAFPYPALTQVTQSPGNPAPDPQQPSAAEQYVKSVSQQAIEFITQNPGELTQFILSHLVNSQVQTILLLPSTWRPLDSVVSFLGHRSLETFSSDCCSMQTYTRRLPFWHRWDANIPLQSTLPILINILLVSWGFHIAWQRKGIAGLAPIAFSMTYILLNALFRNSGGRYILPVDWILLVYFCIGLVDLTTRLLHKITYRKLPAILEETRLDYSSRIQPRSLFFSPKFYSLSAAFLLLGCLIPLTEKAFQPMYTPEIQAEMVSSLHQSGLLDGAQSSILEDFLDNGGSVSAGRALYPRFFRENLGEPGSNNPLGPLPYPRIGFYLAGPQHFPVVLPSVNKPGYLPHASDVLVFLCSPQEIFAVAVFDQTQNVHSLYWRSPLPLNLSCPFPPQDISVQPEK